MRPAMAAPRRRNAAPRHGIEVTAMLAPGRLKDKVAVVFGAGPNIGGTIAHFLARAGAQVAVSDIDADAAQATAQFLTARGYAAAAFAGDAVEEAAVARVVTGAVERFGHVDVVVNMAGKVHWSSVLDMDLAQWREAVLSFPTAGMLTTKHGAKAMIAGGRHGSIIHLLSTAAHFGEADGAPIPRRRQRCSTWRARPPWTSRMPASASTPSPPAPWSTNCGPTCARKSSIAISSRRRGAASIRATTTSR